MNAPNLSEDNGSGDVMPNSLDEACGEIASVQRPQKKGGTSRAAL
jgi:hypothetical protein